LYKIKLDKFEGPLDLLLFFIKRDELDIYDIPIAKITGEFLEYVNLIKMLDLEIAGDFILMAATLMHIKVRMLLPREIDEKGEEIDPRADLIAALLEYKKYKEMSEELSFFESSQRKLSYRGNFSLDNKEAPPEYDILLKNITIFDLAKAFKKAIEGLKPQPVHEVQKINITIDEMIEYILNRLNTEIEVHFLSLVENMREKIRIVITFVALLELTKVGSVLIKESPDYNDFVLVKGIDG
jgi:segregation and condensation protein A